MNTEQRWTVQTYPSEHTECVTEQRAEDDDDDDVDDEEEKNNENTVTKTNNEPYTRKVFGARTLCVSRARLW